MLTCQHRLRTCRLSTGSGSGFPGSDELELGLARVPELTYPEDPIDVAQGRFDDSQTILHSGTNVIKRFTLVIYECSQ